MKSVSRVIFSPGKLPNQGDRVFANDRKFKLHKFKIQLHFKFI